MAAHLDLDWWGGHCRGRGAGAPPVFATQDIIDVAAPPVVVAVLIGLYALRRHAREVLVYDRRVPTSGSGPVGTEPEEAKLPTPEGTLEAAISCAKIC